MNIIAPQPGKLLLIVTTTVLVNCMAIQSNAQIVDYTFAFQAKNDSKATTKKTQKVIKMRLKTPGSDNEWLRIEVNGNTVKPVHTIRTKRKFSGLINSALGAVSPVPLPNVRFDKWLDAPTTRVVFQPDSCPVSPPPQPPQNQTPQVNSVTPPPQPPQNQTPQGNSVTPAPQPPQNQTPQVNSVTPPPQPPQNPTAEQVQVSPPPQPPQNQTPQVSQVTPPPQPPQNQTPQVSQVTPPQPPQNPTAEQVQVTQAPQPPQNPTPQVSQVTPPPQPALNSIQENSVTPPPQQSKNSSLPDQMNSISNCAIAGTVSVLLPEGTDIYKGRFTIEYTQGDLLRSITFRIRDEDN